MMFERFALVCALAGCGRIGFQDVSGLTGGDAGSDGVAGDMVTVVVTSDEYLNEPPGMPIAGATVLVERSAGTDRLVTDATGRAQFAATGAIVCHVIYQSSIGWRGYTVQPPAGTIELGSRPAFNQNFSITFALPASAGAGDYTVRMPEHCAFPPYSGSPSVGFTYDPACEGAAVHLVGFVRTPVGSRLPDLYLDAGTVTLINGATHMVSGSYQELPMQTLQLTDLPAGSTSAGAEVVARAGLDLTSLSPNFYSVAPSGGAATLQEEVAPGANSLEISVSGGLPAGPYLMSSELIAPISGATPQTFSATDMLPLFESMTITDPTRITWTGGAGGTITIVERVGGDFRWDWYLPPSATVARLPAIPPDLGVPVPQVPSDASVTKLDVPGAVGGDLVPTIDRRWSAWPHDAMLLPATGGAWTQILYTAALGPP